MLMRFADQEGITITQAFVETQSGKHDDSRRPQLKAALEAARKLKAPILVAKLDRLSRDVAYIAGLVRRFPGGMFKRLSPERHSGNTGEGSSTYQSGQF